MNKIEQIKNLTGREAVVHLRVSDEQRETLQALVYECLESIDDPQQEVLALAKASRSIVASVLNDNQLLILKRFINPGNHTAIILENLPIGMIGVTPSNGLRPSDKDVVSEAVMHGVGGILGYPMGFNNEKDGEIIQQVVPLDDIKVTNTNSSRANFGFHVDNIFVRPQFRQELIALFCLRNPGKAATLLLELPELIRHMPDEMWDWAFEPHCRFPASSSFDMGGSLVFTEPRPILYKGGDNLPRINANSYNMRGLTPADDVIIADFVALANKVEPHRIVLSPGDLLIFHDDFAMHGREPFEGDRWLQRMYLRFNLDHLWAVAGDRATRVFDVRHFFFN